MKKLVNLFCFLVLAQFALSQRGTYVLGSIPTEARGNYMTPDGAYEVPIRLGTTTLQLKFGNRVKIVYVDYDKKVTITKATWKVKGKVIQITYKDEVGSPTYDFQLVTFKSGTYLHMVGTTSFYKKKGG